MCGIAGIANMRSLPPPPREALSAMVWALSHRGPDARALYRDARAGLAHARRSSTDVGRAAQPMSDAEGVVWLAFDGDLFDEIELRERLEVLGYRFRTRSAAEVFATAYAAWGESALSKLRGQWAAALWRPDRDELVLSRDRMGTRPLYYAERAGRVVFASEIEAVCAAVLDVSRGPVESDEDAALSAPRTAFAAVAELEPGCVRVYKGGGVSQRGRAAGSSPRSIR